MSVYLFFYTYRGSPKDYRCSRVLAGSLDDAKDLFFKETKDEAHLLGTSRVFHLCREAVFLNGIEQTPINRNSAWCLQHILLCSHVSSLYKTLLKTDGSYPGAVTSEVQAQVEAELAEVGPKKKPIEYPFEAHQDPKKFVNVDYMAAVRAVCGN